MASSPGAQEEVICVIEFTGTLGVIRNKVLIWWISHGLETEDESCITCKESAYKHAGTSRRALKHIMVTAPQHSYMAYLLQP